MEKCAFCGAPTELYYNGVPVCLRCEKERYPQEKIATSESTKADTETTSNFRDTDFGALPS
jgi:hypothetical protein